MNYDFFKLLHLIGMMLLFFSLGAVLQFVATGGEKKSYPWRALVSASHGISLSLLLIGGLGLLYTRFQFSFPIWAIAKIIIWLVLGGILTAIYKQREMGKRFWFLIPALGALAAFLAIYHPGQ
ncbi:hypothetical protein LPTSP4_32000 [Leptospira ryugenii]|uniref:Invasion protein expression up-regulator SirB n=1 Tax=Leptospira ryugenii TaxID=1917863 RepID=A0A2P2E462_9LEPT|nr:hypothetical protein [Leptospira ryugenii]GBF51662.1 hypothetical protein LPTSP4_32000 [Leptospira ryugenii]